MAIKKVPKLIQNYLKKVPNLVREYLNRHYMSKPEIEEIKKVLRVTLWGALFALCLIALSWNLFKGFSGWSIFILVFVVSLVLCRLKRNNPRRCPTCRVKGRLFGWRFKKLYWREWQGETESLCVFTGFCLDCECEYKIKDPVLKSFGHRPMAVRNW